MVNERVQVILLANRALVVCMDVLPWSVWQFGWFQGLLVCAWVISLAGQACLHILPDHVPHAREPVRLPQCADSLVVSQVPLMCKLHHYWLQLPGYDQLLPSQDHPIHHCELWEYLLISRESLPAHSLLYICDQHLHGFILIRGLSQNISSHCWRKLLIHHSVDIYV